MYKGRKGTTLGYNAIHSGYGMQELTSWLRLPDVSTQKLVEECGDEGIEALIDAYDQLQERSEELRNAFELDVCQWSRLLEALSLLKDGLLCDGAKLQDSNYEAWLAELKVSEQSVGAVKEAATTLPELIAQHRTLEHEGDTYKSKFHMEDEQYDRLLQKL